MRNIYLRFSKNFEALEVFLKALKMYFFNTACIVNIHIHNKKTTMERNACNYVLLECICLVTS